GSMTRSMSRNPEDVSLEAEVAAAEAEAAAGQLPKALSRYTEILRKRIATGGGHFDQADAIVITRCAEFAVPCGHPFAASKLLAALHSLLEHAGNRYAADLVAVKHLHLAISSGERSAIAVSLDWLRPTIGEMDQIAFDTVGLATF